MEKMIKVVVKEVGKPCEVREIGNSLKPLQDIVGGYVQSVPFTGKIDMMCNEERKLIGLPLNFAWDQNVIVGNALFTAVDSKGEGRSLTEDELQLVLEIFSRAQSI